MQPQPSTRIASTRTKSCCVFALLAPLFPAPMSSFNFAPLGAGAAADTKNVCTMEYDHHHRHYCRQQQRQGIPESSHRMRTTSWRKQWFLHSGISRGGAGGGDAVENSGSRSRSSSRRHLRAKRESVRNSNALDKVGDGARVPSSTSRCLVTGASAGVQRGGGGCGGEALVLDRVKNIRDLGSIEGSGIVKGRVYRTGYLSEATEADAERLRDVTGLKTLVDLRSAKELERDELLHSDVYRGFENIMGSQQWRAYKNHQRERQQQPRRSREDNMPTQLVPDTMEEALPAFNKSMFTEMTGMFWNGDEGTAEPSDGEDLDRGSRRRFFVSLIDESIYRKGVFQRLRRRHKAAVLALAPAMIVSRRSKKKARSIFMQEINAGGLILLNELLLQYSGEGINRVLRLLATRERHPVALYCTAGKDRTGLVMALTLAVLGVPDKAIVDDYAESDAAYQDLDDDDAMVGALAQEDLDPDTFLRAPRHVMEDIFRFIRKRYGSVDGYLDSIGFDYEWRERLRDALLVE